MRPADWIGYREHLTPWRLSWYRENAGKGGYTIFGALIWQRQRRNLQGLPWCATFVHAVVDRPDILGKAHPGTRVLQRRMKRRRYWRGRGYLPEPGDLIFLSNAADGRVDHCGIVEKATLETVSSIDGNTTDPEGIFPKGAGGVVGRNIRSRMDPRIVGYGAIGRLTKE